MIVRINEELCQEVPSLEQDGESRPTAHIRGNAAKLARIDKPVNPHPSLVCYTFTAKWYEIRTIQELLSHKDVKTTMIDTHVLQRGPYAEKFARRLTFSLNLRSQGLITVPGTSIVWLLPQT